MRTTLLYALLIGVICFFTPINAIQASNAVTPAEAKAAFLQKASAQMNVGSVSNRNAKSARLERMLNRVERKWRKKMDAGLEVDFSDPVNKWLWFGLFGLGAALVLGIFSLGLGGLVAFLAVVCLVIWLVKQSGAA